MRLPVLALALLVTSAMWSLHAAAQSASSSATPSTSSTSTTTVQAPPQSPQPAVSWQPDDRIILSADGATLTGTSGGGGGSITYLHEPNPDALLGAGSEYQRLAGAYWAFASLNGAYSHNLTSSVRWDVHADVHEGIGNTRPNTSTGQAFDYAIEAAGTGLIMPGGVSLDAEERQFDVDTSHGSLPKATLTKSWGTHLLTTLAYAHSLGGNLDTEYGMARIDIYGRGFGLLGGASIGRVTPAVVNLAGVLTPQAKHLSEPFVGVSKSIAHLEFTLLGDDLNLAGIRHLTMTLNCLVHL